MPDPTTLTILPWQPNVARFACNITVEGEEWPFCPRTILRHALERATAQGYELRIGAELEYFLRSTHARTAGSRSPTHSTRSNYLATTCER